jgi:hypothetical protein
MGKLTRDDAYQGPEEVHGVQQPPQRIFTHLFDFEVDQIHPLLKPTGFWPEAVSSSLLPASGLHE